MADRLIVDDARPVLSPPAPEEGDEALAPPVLLGSEEEGDGFALAGDEETLNDVESGKKKSDPVPTAQPQEASLSLQEIWRLPDKYYLLQNAPYAIEKINEVVKIPQTLRITDGDGRVIERKQEVTIYEIIFKSPITPIKAKEITILSETIIEDVPDSFRYRHNVWVTNDQLPDGTLIDSIPTDEQVQTFNPPDSGTEHVTIANRTTPVVYTPHLETDGTINLRLYTDTVWRGNCYERNRFGYTDIIHASQELGVQIPAERQGFDDTQREYIDTQTQHHIDALGYLIDEKGYKVDLEGKPVFKERTYRTQNTWQTITLTPVPGQEIPPSGKFYIPSMDNILFLDESTQYPIEQTGQWFTIHPTVTGMVEIRGWFLDDYSTKPDGEPPIYRFYWTQKLGSITPTELAAQPVTAPEPEAAPQTEELEKPSRVERKPEEPWDVKKTTIINPGPDSSSPSADDVVIETRIEYDDWLNNIHTTSITQQNQTTITEHGGETTTRTYEPGAPLAEHEIAAPH